MEEHAGQIPPERPELRAEAEARAAEIVSGLLSRDNPLLCCVHPEEEAAASCRRCGRPLCFRCFSDSYPELLCPDCRTLQHRRELIRGGIRALRLPVLWVMLCVILSGTVYLAGFNNPSLEGMVRRDARRRWFQQEAPRLCLMRAARRAYHMPRPKNQLIYRFKVLLYTVFLLVTIALTLALATVSQRMLAFAGRYITLPAGFIDLWDFLRFPALGVVVFGAVGLLYAMAQDTRQPGRNIVPGVVVSLVAWIALSAGYSFYVENFANYSLIYGTLGTMVVLMIWLYLTATVLIMGAEINDALLTMREENRRKAGKKGKGETS